MYICFNCKKTFELKDIKGSNKAPFCKKCFDKIFGSDEVYLEYLREGKDCLVIK